MILWTDLINLPPSWSSSSFEAKNKKNIPTEAIDKEIDNNDIVQALQTIGLSEKVSLSSAAWERHDSIVSIPWNVKSDI